MTRAAVLAAALWAAFGPARADDRVWRIDGGASVIAFEYALNDKPAAGRFTRVAGMGAFDPLDPEDATLTLEIDVTSLDLGDPVESAFALSVEWFDAKDHPSAVYRLAQLTALPDGRFEALGDLTIKGRQQVIRTPITLRIEGDMARAQGALAFDRRDFNVGLGASALFANIGTDVAVRFDIVARAQ